MKIFEFLLSFSLSIIVLISVYFLYVLMYSKNIKHAFLEFKAVINDTASSVKIIMTGSENLFEAQAKYKKREFKSVKALCYKELRHNPKNISMRVLLTKTLIELNDLDQAEKTIQEAINIDSIDSIYNSLKQLSKLYAEILLKKGEYDEGKTVLLEYLKKNPYAENSVKQIFEKYNLTGSL